MSLSFGGISSRTLLLLADKSQSRQIELIQGEPRHSRAIEAFRSRVSDIGSPAELVQDFEVYSFVMEAFDLKEQIFGKALIRKMLESDPADSEALINRLTDSRFKELHTALGFVEGGALVKPDLSASAFQADVIDKYLSRAFIDMQSDQNEDVGAVLEFRAKAGEVKTWYDVLKDVELAEFMRTALGIPNEVVQLTVEKQKSLFEDKYDISKLRIASERDDLINRYLVFREINDMQSGGAMGRVAQLFQPISLKSNNQFIPITLNIPVITYSASDLY